MLGIHKKKDIKLDFTEPLEIVKIVTSVLTKLKIPYLIGGSLASSLHGIPRATQDIDIVADINIADIVRLVESFKDKFYIDADMIRDAIEHKSSFNMIHLSTMYKVDVFIKGDNNISDEEMSRRKRYILSEETGDEIYLASAEDIVLQKLHWFHMGGRISDRQWKDVLGVLQVQGNRLDFRYLKDRAKELEVLDLLDEALEDSKFD